MQPISTVQFFTTPDDFRKWLADNHSTAKEVFVGYYKVSSGIQGITWSESVDQALCYGWIDSVRRKVDDKSYCNRFTPRRSGSNWSEINKKKVEDLFGKGLMMPTGILALPREFRDPQ
jgi:uncharacterized protein YdeI (YjbR/CyaY-like superfamily)